ncbi:MAG: hypothetical protein SPK03_02130 [Alloprevotella sp.]|nr:hypothetical protein [Alloprevotella sp.]
MRHKHFLPLLATLSLGSLCACSDDGAEAPPPSLQPAPTQVVVVFPPGELGDQGYSDNILHGVQQIRTTDEATGRPVADVEFWSLEDVEVTRDAIRSWVLRRDNPYFSGQTYTRRLLVMTSPTLLGFLDPNSLQEEDDILLLDTPESTLSLPAYAAIADRMHVINISAASATHRYCDLLENWSTQLDEEAYRKVVMLRWFEDMVHSDSVSEVLEQRLGSYKPIYVAQEANEEGLENRRLAANFLGYYYATELNSHSDDYDEHACIVNLGPGNAGFDTYMLNHKSNFITLLLDSESSLSHRRYAIVREFGRALSEWVNSWLTQQGTALPRVTWHGGWDGYCTTDISDSHFITE